MTTQAQIRRAFWQSFPQHEEHARKRGTLSKGQNAQTTDCRMAFCDFVESLSRDGVISGRLASNVAL
jgi:hypothetical protein